MKVGINGFGRIGRQVFRIAWDYDGVEVVHVNDVADASTLASLLQFDTTYGRWGHRVRGEGKALHGAEKNVHEGQALHVDGTAISVSAERDPAKLLWAETGVDVVLEATGVFRRKEDAAKHRAAGAKKVLVSAPGKSPLDGDFVIGVNDDRYDRARHHVVSIGSCTTNCLAPVAKVIHEEFRIEHGLIDAVHAYTASQSLLDGPHENPHAAALPRRIWSLRRPAPPP